MLNSVNQAPMFEWCVVRCGSKNGHYEDMCLKEIELHAQNLLIILGSIVKHQLGKGGDLVDFMAPTLLTLKN